MEDTFRDSAYLIPIAITNLASFTQWYREKFDVQLHHETTQMLEDSALLFETANHFLMLCRANDVEPTAEMADSTAWRS